MKKLRINPIVAEDLKNIKEYIAEDNEEMELFEYIDLMQQLYDIFYTDSVHSPLHWHY